MGAVVLVGTASGGSDAVLGTAYLSGTGTGGLGVLVTGNVLPVAGQFGLYTARWAMGSRPRKPSFTCPAAMAVDGAGNLYIADGGHNRVRMVCASATSATIQGTSCSGAGIIATIAGDGNPAYTGDGGAGLRRDPEQSRICGSGRGGQSVYRRQRQQRDPHNYGGHGNDQHGCGQRRAMRAQRCGGRRLRGHAGHAQSRPRA